jgi:NTE family protein
VTNIRLLGKKMYVREVEVEGLKNISRAQIKSIFGPAINTEVSSGELDDIILKLESANLFDRVTYRFDNSNGQGKLVLRVIEKARGDFDVGINYNTYHQASLLLGLQYKRALFKGATAKADIRLSSMPRLDLAYYYQSRLRPAIGIEGSLNNIEQGLFTDNVKITTSYTIFSSLYVKAKYDISNQRNVGIGAGIEQVNLRTDAFLAINQITSLRNSRQASALMVFYREDSRDDTYIPTKGGRVLIDAYWVNNNFSISKSWFSGLIRLEKHNRFTHNIHLSNYVNIGLNDANYQAGNSQFLFTSGGMLDMRFRNYIPFAGLDFGQILTRNILHYRIKPTYRLVKNNYLAALFDIAQTATYVEDLLTIEGIQYAYGVSYEYNSPIGPVQFNMSRSNIKKEFLFYLNLGYWF